MGDHLGDPITPTAEEDPTNMLAAALTHLTDVVQSLQGEMTRMQAQMASSPPVQGTSVPQTVPATAPTAQAVSASQVTGKLKLLQPKPHGNSQQPGAVENFIFECEQHFIGMDVPEDKRVFYASGLLEGPLKTWWRHACTVAQAAGTLDTLFVWSTFRAELLARFM
jgi:hypothetical protein